MIFPQLGVLVPLEHMVALLAFGEPAVHVAVPLGVVVWATRWVACLLLGQNWWHCLQDGVREDAKVHCCHEVEEDVALETNHCCHQIPPCYKSGRIVSKLDLTVTTLDQDQPKVLLLQKHPKLDTVQREDHENPKC